jgi:hypothetical protein
MQPVATESLSQCTLPGNRHGGRESFESVTCNRAEQSPAIAVYSGDSARLQTVAIDEGWFDAGEVLIAQHLMNSAAFTHAAPILQSG